MKKIFLASFALLATTVTVKAQDLEQVKKTIDAEKYADAKATLKNMIGANPEKGKNYFYLGQVYLALEKTDSAKIYFDKGVAVKDAAHLNQVGLGQVNLINDNPSAAEINFATAMASAKKKDVEELIYITKGYLKAKNPNVSKAIETAKKATLADPNSALAQLALGDAHSANKNANDAYVAYRNATDLDPTLLRAKIQLAISTRNSMAYPEAITALTGIINSNGNYGPAYRELAETNMAWAFNKPKMFDEKIAVALQDYKKYMSLTDSSTDSKVKYADFLVLSKKWTELETIALEIQKADKVNPKILRYLGYARFENGNKAGAAEALNSFISKPGVKVNGKDYMYLAKAKMANAQDVNGIITNQTTFNEALTDLTKAAELNPAFSTEFTEMGITLYKTKSYLEASRLFDLATKNTASKTLSRDNYLLGSSILYLISGKTDVQKTALSNEIARANKAFNDAIATAAKPQDIYLNKARLNQDVATEASKTQATVDYEGYVKTITDKNDAAELANVDVIDNLYEAYTNIGANLAVSDKNKAIESFKKAALLKPTDTYATEAIQALSSGASLTKSTKATVTTPTKTPTQKKSKK